MVSIQQPVTCHRASAMTRADEAQRLREACHDMKQPLACVFALAAAALAEPDLPRSAADRLEQIVEQVRWLRDMIEQFLHGDHHPGDRVRLLDLAILAGETAAAERLVYDGQIGFTRPSEPVLAWGDPVDIRRIIANLLGNATRAAGSPGRVQINVRNEQQTALLSIDDSGPGFGRIPERHGLGLQSVARSTGRCEGSVQYGSSPLGGVRVRLCLPMAFGPARRGKQEQVTLLPGTGIRLRSGIGPRCAGRYRREAGNESGPRTAGRCE